MARRGRPTKYTPEIANRICKLLAEGLSLRAICDDDKYTCDMPSRETVRAWLKDNDDFLGQYTRAREEQADFYADEMIEIADTTDDPNKARLQIDARKWKAARMAPRKWGDKTQTELSGPNGGKIEGNWTVEFLNATPPSKP